jgi:ABC-type transport system involved in multi-copper enzyme maturation permease subunit
VTRILWVELRRFAWRRSFRFFGLVAIGGIILAGIITFFTSHPGPIPVDSFDPGFRLRTLTEIFGGTSIPLIILGLAFGASFIGAEWHAGTITPLLTWAPRRIPVILGKVVAAMIGVFLSAIALQTILGVVLWLVALMRGTTEGTDLAWFGETIGVALRGATVAALMSTLGFAIGSIARNTTTALIIGFVYFAIGEALIRGLKPGWQPWLVGDNAAAFLVANPDDIFFAGVGRTTLSAFLVVVAYAGAATALATAWFQTRDVT